MYPPLTAYLNPVKVTVISEKENTWGMRVLTSLNSRSLSWLSEVETNGGGIFIPVNRLNSFF